ncbi:hypothetical protein GCM10027589_07490 [Actinocorallia lasiicapitis]
MIFPRKKLAPVTAVVLGTAAVGASVFVSLASARAETPPLNLVYACDYPMIGMQDIAVSIVADIPDAWPADGEVMAKPKITATTAIPAETVELLNLMKGATLEGNAGAAAAFKLEGSNEFTSQSAPAAFPVTPIPASGPMTVIAKGEIPVAFGSSIDYWMQIYVANIDLKITVKDKAGTPTALGAPFTAKCYQKPGQKNLLTEIKFGQPADHPAPPKYTPLWIDNWTRPPLEGKKTTKEFVYTCQKLPILGSQKFKVKTTVTYPAAVPSTVYTPKVKIDSITELNTDTVEGLNLIFGTGIKGSAVAQASLFAPDIPGGAGLGVQIGLPIEKTPIPQSDFGPWPTAGLPANGEAPSLLLKTPGQGRMTVGGLEVTMTPVGADGKPTDIGTFTRSCVMDGDQDPTVATFAVTANTGPAKPTGVVAEKIGETSFRLNWDDIKDPDGDAVVRYEVRKKTPAGTPGGLMAYSKTSEVDVLDLTPGRPYQVVVWAYDSRGGISEASAPLAVTTAEEGAPPAEPAPPAAPEPPKEPENAPPAATPPAVPAGVTASKVAADSFHLDWADSVDPAGGAVHYELYVNGQKMPGEAAGSEADVNGLTPATKYTVTVVAVNAKGDKSEASAPVEITTG